MGFGNSLAFVRSVPPTIGPGSLHLRQAARRHHSLVDHCFDPAAVTQRPRTLWTPGRESLHVGVVVVAAGLSIDPAVLERNREGLLVSQCRRGRVLLRHDEPEARDGVLMFNQPGAKGIRRVELGRLSDSNESWRRTRCACRGEVGVDGHTRHSTRHTGHILT